MPLNVTWEDHRREPQCPPDPLFPHGKDVDCSLGARAACYTTLQCPAPRCGIWRVHCDACGLTVGVTAAGRPDDPRSLKIACAQAAERYPQPNPGPTGEFPDGKLNPSDEGQLTLAVHLGEDGKTVVIEFGKKIEWIGLAPEQAIQLAFSILNFAGVNIQEVKKGSKPS